MKVAAIFEKSKKEWILFGVFVLIFILMSLLSPNEFLSRQNLQSMAYQLPEFGLLSLGMMIIVLTGGINLSITNSAALAAIVGGATMAKLSAGGGSDFVAIAVGIVVFIIIAIACGAVNGFVVAFIGVAPMLVTLGTMTLFEGVSLYITKGGAISGFPLSFFWFGNDTILSIPVPLWIFILFAILTTILLERHRFGHNVYMVGCNPKSSYFSGINVKRVLFLVYLYSGLLAGIAGIIMASRYNSAKESYGSSYLLQSIAATVLGGTDINGGSGKVIGTILAVMILQIISSGLNIFGFQRFLTNVMMGAILVAVLIINYFNSKKA